MTKLTTERLEELANATTPSVKYVGREIIAMARQLLAYEQAAKNPIGSFHISGGQVEATTDYCRDGEWPVQDGEVLVYAAPVLPKQPDVTLTNEGETYKIIKAAEKLVRCKGRYHSEQNYRALAALFGVTVPDLPPLPSDEAPAQPVSEPYKLNCWSCGNSFTYTQRLECDGYCPHCDSPIDLDEDEEALKAVPLEPTKEMVSMAWREAAGKCDHETIKRIYVTMISAAPAQESE